MDSDEHGTDEAAGADPAIPSPLPSAKVFRAGADSELVHADVLADGDPRLAMPLGDGVTSRPLWISLAKNSWCDILRAERTGLLQRHYHPHEVHGLCLSGRWRYLEHDWVATAGTFVYESPGESHTLVVEESGEPMRTLFIVKGPLIWLDDEGEPAGIYDAFEMVDLLRAHYDANGVGADHVDTLLRG